MGLVRTRFSRWEVRAWAYWVYFSYLCGMGRILALDYGTKRCGLAVTDPLQIIASGLATVPTSDLFSFLEAYLAEEAVERMIVGYPVALDGSPTRITHLVKGVLRQLEKRFPDVEIVSVDERYSSKEAEALLLQTGLRPKKRRDKGLIDKLSAAIILKDYMEVEVWSKKDCHD